MVSFAINEIDQKQFESIWLGSFISKNVTVLHWLGSFLLIRPVSHTFLLFLFFVVVG